MRNIILKTITYIFAFIMIFCICCIDTQNTTIFYIGIIVSALWLVPFGIANGVFKND